MSRTCSMITQIRQLTRDRIGSLVFSLTKAVGGQLAAGTVNIRVSAVTEHGESIPAARVSIAVLLNDKVTISISRIAEAREYRIYASMGTAAETYQGSVTVNQSGHTAYTLSTLVTGSAMPSTDTATIHVELSSYQNALESAVAEYSNNFLRVVYSDIALTTSTLAYDLPANWEDGFSTVRQAQYPLADVPPEYMLSGEYYVKDGKFHFVTSPRTGETLRLYYAIHHEVDDTASPAVNTIPTYHQNAVCMIAASHACEIIAAKYAHQSNMGAGADIVDFKMRSSDFRKLAETYRTDALKQLGMSKGAAPASGVVGWWPPRGS
jgi:hypothetical protein